MRNVIGFLLWALTASYCFATTNLWTGAGGDGLWSNGANWSTGEAPTMQDHVEIVAPGTYTVTIDTQAGAASIVVGGTSGQQTLHPQERVDAASLTVGTNGALMLTSSSFLYAVITNHGTIHVAGEQVLVGRNFWNEGIIQAAANQGKVALNIENADFVNRGTIAIGTNTTLLLGSSLSRLSSPVSVGEGVLQLTGNTAFEGPTSFGTDVLFSEGSITGDSIWSGPGKFFWAGGALHHGSATLSSNFNFRILGEATIPTELDNFSITNYGTIALETGAEVIARSLNPEEVFTNWTDRLENHGVILLPPEYCRIPGIVNRGNIVSTNGWVQLQSRAINANAGGTFTIGTDSEIELLDRWFFEGTTRVAGPGRLTMDADFYGGGEVIAGGPILIRDADFSGDYAWNGSGEVVWQRGYFGWIGDGTGSTTFGPNLKVVVPAPNSSAMFHNVTNFGEITFSDPSPHRLTSQPENPIFVNRGKLNIVSNALVALGTLVNEGVVDRISGRIELNGSVTNNGTLNLHSGSIRVQPQPCSEPNCVPATGTFVSGANSTLSFMLTGSEPLPRIVSGNFNAGGTVQVQLANSFIPTNQQQFRFVLCTNGSGAFTSYELPPLPTPKVWLSRFSESGLILQVTELRSLDVRKEGTSVVVSFPVSPAVPHHLQVSTNLVDWLTVHTNFSGSFVLDITDSLSQMFYRTLEP